MVIIGILVCVFVGVLIGIFNFNNNNDTKNVKEVKKIKKKKEKKMKNIIKKVVSWLIAKIYAVKEIEASVAGFRTIVPVSNTRTVVMVEVLETLNIPFEMELFAFVTCKRIFKVNLNYKITKLIKKLKFQIKALKRETLKKEKKIIKNNIKMLKKAIEKLNKHYKKIQTINNIMWFVEIIGNEKGGTMLPEIAYRTIEKIVDKISLEPRKGDKEYLEKIKYGIIFHRSYDKKNEEFVYTVDILSLEKLKKDAATSIEAKKWLDEFYKKLPQKFDIERKRESLELYNNAVLGVKILEDTLILEKENVYVTYINKGNERIRKEYTAGELIAYALYIFMVRYYRKHNIKLIPSLEMGPQKVVYFAKDNLVMKMLEKYKLTDAYNKIGLPQKQVQRIHKIFAPLTLLPEAKVYVGKVVEIDGKKFQEFNDVEGIIYVSETYAKKAGLVEGEKTAFTLKSLIHIVPDIELTLGNIETKETTAYDVIIGSDENKWKLSGLQLKSIINAFTGKIPEVNARTMKPMVLKENAMCFLNMNNNLREETIKLFEIFNEIKNNWKNVSKFTTEDGKSFKPEYEKVLYDLVSIIYFNKEDEESSEQTYILYDKALKMLNKKYTFNKEYYTHKGMYKYKEYVRFETDNGTVSLNYETIKEIGDEVARYIKRNIAHAHLMGCSGTAFPMEYKSADAFPISNLVTNNRKYKRICNKYARFKNRKEFQTYCEEKAMGKHIAKIYYTEITLEEALANVYSDVMKYMKIYDKDMSYKTYIDTQNAKMEKVGISKNMMYVQRHPSVLGVWTELWYSPTTKLFYIDSKLWKTYFGGDFDGDTFTALYPYHPLNKDMNNLTQKIKTSKEPIHIIDPIDNMKMVQLIDRKDQYIIDIPKYLGINNISINEFLVKLPRTLQILIEKYKLEKEKEKANMIVSSELKNVKPNLYKSWAEIYDAQQVVGKIHSIVCNMLVFYTKSLNMMEELIFSTYFILKYVQPAISGLKHDDKAKVPEAIELIKEMNDIYKRMFPAKANNVKYITIDKITNHEQIYKTVRKFKTIAHKKSNDTDENGDGIYYYDDLYFNYRNNVNFVKGINGDRRNTASTYWTSLWIQLIDVASLYEKVIYNNKKEPTPPTPSNNSTKPKTEMKEVKQQMKTKITTSMIPVNKIEKPTEVKIEKPIETEEPIKEIPNISTKSTMTPIINTTMTPVKDDVIEIEELKEEPEVVNNIKKEEVKMKKVFFSGSHTLKMLPQQAKKVLKLAKEKEVTILVGDCHGADALIQKELIGYKNVIVYSMYQNPRNNLGNWKVKTIPNSYTEKVDYAIWQQQKDIAMSQDCTSAVALWDGNSNGTRANKDRVEAMKKKVLLITAPNGEPMPFLQTNIIPRTYAGIGDVNIPANIQELMKMIGEELAHQGYVLRTGGAKGADTAFMEGCDKAKGIKEIFYPSDIHVNAKTLKIAKEIHGHWEYCENKQPKPGNKYSFPVQAHCRNMKIINGDLLNNPVEFTIAYQDINQVTGGTWQGIKYSKKLGIKVYNLFVEKDRNEIIDIVFRDEEQKEKVLKLFNITKGGHEMNKTMTPVSSTSEQKVESKVVIYTDGSYNTKTNVGSWAYVILKDSIKVHEASGKTKENFLTSRNIAGECTAVLKALQYCDANNITKVEIHHDLEGVQKWAQPVNGEKRWKATTEITKIYQTWFDKYTKKISVDFVHVKGHSKETWNDYVDELAGIVSGTHSVVPETKKENIIKDITIKDEKGNLSYDVDKYYEEIEKVIETKKENVTIKVPYEIYLLCEQIKKIVIRPNWMNAVIDFGYKIEPNNVHLKTKEITLGFTNPDDTEYLMDYVKCSDAIIVANLDYHVVKAAREEYGTEMIIRVK